MQIPLSSSNSASLASSASVRDWSNGPSLLKMVRYLGTLCFAVLHFRGFDCRYAACRSAVAGPNIIIIIIIISCKPLADFSSSPSHETMT